MKYAQFYAFLFQKIILTFDRNKSKRIRVKCRRITYAAGKMTPLFSLHQMEAGMFYKITKAITKATVVLGLFGAASFMSVGESFAGQEAVVYALVGAETTVPFGWIDFCQRYRSECPDEDRAARDVEFTAAVFKKIQRVNAYVNKTVAPVTDANQWRVIDQWDYPEGKGDCEDFALLKRNMLIAEGFPRQALLMTVVKDKNGDGHAVLTVKTSRGEFILDNMADAVKLWTSTSYRFVKRQSQQNPNMWVAIGGPTSAAMYVSK